MTKEKGGKKEKKKEVEKVERMGPENFPDSMSSMDSSFFVLLLIMNGGKGGKTKGG